MKSNTVKILLILVLLLAVGAGALAWFVFGKAPEVPAFTAAETTAVTETTEPPTEAAPIETTAETQSAEEPAPAETAAETTAAEPAEFPQKLTQADFADKLSDLTAAERNTISQLSFQGGGIYSYSEEDIGKTFPDYANLDLDKDGKTDWFSVSETGMTLHMGNGSVSQLDMNLSSLGSGYSAGMLFQDINGTGKDDILMIYITDSTVGRLLDIALFTDTAGRYYRQQLPLYKFTLEDLHNDYVLLRCPDFHYREVMPIGGTAIQPYLQDGQTLFDFYFGGPDHVEETEHYHTRSVKIDGKKLIVLYDFMTKSSAAVTSNPFGVVYRLEPGGYFVIDHMGTDVVREYWLS